MNYKTCTKCGEEFEATTEFFNKHKGGKFGLRAICKRCRFELEQTEEKREIHRKANRRYNKTEKSKRASKRYCSSEKCKTTRKEYYKTDKGYEVKRKAGRKWQENNKAYGASKSAERRARKLQATPAWADMDLIKRYYDTAATMCDYHVDHIIPLQGKNVCGLHVENNLQLLPARLNESKGNKYPLTREEEVRYKGVNV